jgi:hypothetical protein
MMVENFSILSISARLLARIKISILPACQVAIRQCNNTKPRMIAFRTKKSPSMTIHLMILFD